MDRDEMVSRLEFMSQYFEARGGMAVGDGKLLLMAWAEAAREAAALVKAQTPRVMTLEEALSADECWIEGKNGACGYGDALLTDDEKHVKFFRPHIINTLDFCAYGKDWRCWTAKPTDEQRKAEAWDHEAD